MRTFGKLVALCAVSCCLLAGMLTGCDEAKVTPTPPITKAEAEAKAKAEAPAAAQPAAAEPAAKIATQPVALNAAQPAAQAPAPVAAAATAPTGQLPAPPVVANPAIFGMLKLREPNTLIDRLAAWAALVKPEMNADMVRMQLAMAAGIDLKDFRAGENIGAFALAPAPTETSPKVAVLLPVSHTSKTAQALKERLDSNDMTSVSAGQYMLVTRNDPAGAADAAKQSDSLVALDKTPSPTDVQLFLNIDALMQKFSPLVAMGLQAVQGQIAQAIAQQQQNSPQLALTQAVLQAELQAFQDLINQLQSLTLGVDFGADRIELSALAQGKPGSGLEKGLQAGLVNAPPLAEYLIQDAALVRFQQSVTDAKGFMDLYMKYMTLAIGPTHQAAIDQLKGYMKEFEKFKKIDVGGSLSLTPEGKLLYEILAVSDDNAAYLKLVQDKITIVLNAGPFHDLYKELGFDISIKEDAAKARKVNGADVHHYVVSVQPQATMPADQKERLMKMLGDLTVELANIGDYIVCTIGEPIDALAGRVTAKQQGAPLASKAAFGPGGVFYMDLNLGGMLDNAKMTMPAEQAAAMPSIPKNAPPVMIAGTHANGLAFYRLGMPKGLITAIVESAKEKATNPTPGAPGAAPKAKKAGKRKAGQPKATE